MAVKILSSLLLFLSSLPLATPTPIGPSLEFGPDALHALEDKILLPVKDGDIDTRLVENLEPATSARLQYASRPPSRDTATLDFDMKYPVILLENSAYTSEILCSEDQSSISIRFSDADAFRLAKKTWPEQDLVLVTHHESCNPSDQRGVYLAHGRVPFESPDGLSSSFEYSINLKQWRDVASTLKVGYGQRKLQSIAQATNYQLEKPLMHKKRDDPSGPQRTCEIVKSKGHRCGTHGTIPNGHGLFLGSSVDSFDKCRDECLSRTNCNVMSFDQGQCILLARVLRSGLFTKDSTVSRQWYHRKCFSCSVTGQLSPGAQTLYEDLVANINKDDSGNIIARIPEPDAPTELQVPDIDINDPSGEGAINDALENDGLPSIEQQTEEAVDSLSSVDENDVGEDDNNPDVTIDDPFPDVDDGSRQLVHPTSTKKAPKAVIDAVKQHRHSSRSWQKRNITDRSPRQLEKRWGLGDLYNGVQDFIDDVQDIACDDLISGLIPPVGDACELSDAYDATKCLVTGCYKDLPGGHQGMKYDFTASNTFNGPTFKDKGMLFGYQGLGGVSCEDCSININDITMKGTIIQDLTTGKVTTATVDFVQSTVESLLFTLDTKVGIGGSWDKGLTTVKLGTITTPGVFSIAPQIYHSFGFQWQNDNPMTVTVGGVMKHVGQTTTLDLVSQSSTTSSGWVPSVSARPPALKTPGRFVWTSHMRTSMQMSIQLMGYTIQNVWAMTSQSQFNYDAEVVDDSNSRNTKREASTLASPVTPMNEKRQFVNMIDTVDTARQQKGKNALKCKAGSMRLITSAAHSTDIKFEGSPINLFNHQYTISPRCFPFVKTTCGVLGEAVNNGDFELPGGGYNSLPGWNTIANSGGQGGFRYYLPFENRGENGGTALFQQVDWIGDPPGSYPLIQLNDLSGLCVGTKYVFKVSYRTIHVTTSSYTLEVGVLDDQYQSLVDSTISYDPSSKTDSLGNGVDTWNHVTLNFVPTTSTATVFLVHNNVGKGVTAIYIDNVSVLPK